MDPALCLEIDILSQFKSVAQLIERGDSEIQRWYEDTVVFVSGGTGFLGQQLIEKLLRSTKVKTIYMLLRTKKQKTLEQRLDDFANGPVFDVLRKNQPHFKDKIKLVKGDVSELKLGISEASWTELAEEVNIIVHMAATISFVEPIKVAALNNVRGTREMMTLGKACKNLKSYVHVSTAYSHATSTRINKPVLEQFYPCPVPPATMIHFVENVEQETLDNITPELLKPWPNTYTFTKAIAEEAVRTMSGDLPICIVRPSVVIAAAHEPSPGWIEKSNAYGPSGPIFGVMLGVLHLINGDNDGQIDFIPVDYVNNTIIAAAHQTALTRDRDDQDKDIKIYTIASQRNEMTTTMMMKVLDSAYYEIATNKSLWYNFGHLVKSRTIYTILFWFYHFIPAYFVDFILWAIGYKPIAVQIYDKVWKTGSVFRYFIANSWKFGDKNVQELQKRMSPEDQKIYQFDVENIGWKQYIYVWCLGIRKYILKDGLNKTREGLKKQKYLRIAHYTFMTVYIYTLYKFICLVFWALSSMLCLLNVVY